MSAEAPPVDPGGGLVPLPEQEKTPQSPNAAALAVAKLTQEFRETSEYLSMMPAIDVEEITHPANALK
jgi:hypothetical protein